MDLFSPGLGQQLGRTGAAQQPLEPTALSGVQIAARFGVAVGFVLRQVLPNRAAAQLFR